MAVSASAARFAPSASSNRFCVLSSTCSAVLKAVRSSLTRFCNPSFSALGAIGRINLPSRDLASRLSPFDSNESVVTATFRAPNFRVSSPPRSSPSRSPSSLVSELAHEPALRTFVGELSVTRLRASDPSRVFTLERFDSIALRARPATSSRSKFPPISHRPSSPVAVVAIAFASRPRLPRRRLASARAGRLERSRSRLPRRRRARARRVALCAHRRPRVVRTVARARDDGRTRGRADGRRTARARRRRLESRHMALRTAGVRVSNLKSQISRRDRKTDARARSNAARQLGHSDARRRDGAKARRRSIATRASTAHRDAIGRARDGRDVA